MAQVDEDDVRHVARLARLALTDEGARAMVRELAAILDHMDVLRRVNTDGVRDFGAADAGGMPLRPDVVARPELTMPPLDRRSPCSLSTWTRTRSCSIRIGTFSPGVEPGVEPGVDPDVGAGSGVGAGLLTSRSCGRP